MSSSNSLRRSPLYRQPGAVNGRLTLVDLSHCSRIGFKGADTVAWLSSHDIAMPEIANQARVLESGSINARLSDTEFFIIDTGENDASPIESLRSAWSMDIAERSYILERGDSHACFEISGDCADQMFSKICGIDLRPSKFANLSLAQTSVGKLNAIVIRADKGSNLSFLLLADLSAAEYLWNVIADAMSEFN